MLKTRVIPVLLLSERRCVKTRRFKEPTYLGDAKNILKIFNDKEVDELVILDIMASRQGRGPDFHYLKELTVECFMPVCYGGGVRDIEDIQRLFALGIEKVAINSYAFERPQFIREVSQLFGSQSIVVSMDVKETLFGQERCFIYGGRKNTGMSPEEFSLLMEEYGCGEIFLNSIDRDGLMQGYALERLKRVTQAVKIPVIACGGAGKLEDFRDAVFTGGAAAVAAGSFFVFQGVHRAVLISYPDYHELEILLRRQ